MVDTINNTASAISTDENKVFAKSFFGFKRDDVLSYIECMNNDFAKNKNELLDNIKALEDNLSQARQDKDTLLFKTKELCESLEGSKANYKNAQQNILDMRIELDKATDEAASYKSRLFSKEQESVVLKADNARLNKSIDNLSANLVQLETKISELEQKEIAAKAYANELIENAKKQANTIENSANAQLLQAQADARHEAQLIKQEAMRSATDITSKASSDAVALISAAKQEQANAKQQIKGSAKSIAASVSTLKDELNAVDIQIVNAMQDLQRLTSGISKALAQTENGLETLGVQLKEYPKDMPNAKINTAPKRVAQPNIKHTLAESILEKLTRILK